MKFATGLLVGALLMGSVSVGQNTISPFPTSGTVSRASVIPVIGEPCKLPSGLPAHYQDESRGSDYILGCEPDDGKPPRVGYLQPPSGMSDWAPHWVCDKGYEPDGLEVTWPGGIFTPKPARCKAVTK